MEKLFYTFTMESSHLNLDLEADGWKIFQEFTFFLDLCRYVQQGIFFFLYLFITKQWKEKHYQTNLS